jgi:hypothetical protein
MSHSYTMAFRTVPWQPEWKEVSGKANSVLWIINSFCWQLYVRLFMETKLDQAQPAIALGLGSQGSGCLGCKGIPWTPLAQSCPSSVQHVVQIKSGGNEENGHQRSRKNRGHGGISHWLGRGGMESEKYLLPPCPTGGGRKGKQSQPVSNYDRKGAFPSQSPREINLGN